MSAAVLSSSESVQGNTSCVSSAPEISLGQAKPSPGLSAVMLKKVQSRYKIF